jgi:acetyl esterase/lipase
MTTPTTRPPFDAELQGVLTAIADFVPPTMTPEMIPLARQGSLTPPIDQVLEGRPVTSRDVTIPGHDGDEIVVSVLARDDHAEPGPAVLHLHGGGMVFGDRFAGIGTVVDWVEQFDAVAVSVDYRLAPESPDPFPVEDAYAALVWTAANASELGIDPGKIIVAGGSAGGGLAAGVALLARDRRGPALAGQVLMYPMLDDRNETVSAHQIDGVGVWDRTSNFTGWNALLGNRRGSDDVSIYAAPGRAENLSDLPPAFIDVGSAEVFRDEDVAYASRLWSQGGVAELHVWPGGFHGFDLVAAHTALGRAMISTRTAWVGRLLGRR